MAYRKKVQIPSWQYWHDQLIMLVLFGVGVHPNAGNTTERKCLNHLISFLAIMKLHSEMYKVPS